MGDSIDMKYKSADSGRQFREAEKSTIERKKQSLLAMAERESVLFLRSLGCEDIKLKGNTQSELEFDRGFDGSISIVCTALKGKELEIPLKITVKSGSLIFTSKEEITKLFPQASVKSNTIENDTPDVFSSLVASKNLDIIAKEKEQFSKIAEQQIVNLLRNLKYDNVKLAGNVEVDIGRNADKTYTGTIMVPMNLVDKYGEKKVKIPVGFKNSMLEMPDTLIVQKVIAATQSGQELIEQETDVEVEENIKKIDKEESYKEEETLKVLELGPQANASKEPTLEKQADTNSPLVTNYAPKLIINKAALPDSIVAGDVINLSGVSYKVTSDDATKISTEGTGSTWTLVMLNSDEKPVVSIGS